MVVLPPNATSLIQQMNPVFIAGFEAYYVQDLFPGYCCNWESAEKTVVQSGKNYRIYDCIKNFDWAWGDVTEWHQEEHIWEVCEWHQWITENEDVATICQAVVELENNLKLGVDEDEPGEHLEVVPENWLTSRWNWSKSGWRGKEGRKVQEEKKKNPQEKSQWEI